MIFFFSLFISSILIELTAKLGFAMKLFSTLFAGDFCESNVKRFRRLFIGYLHDSETLSSLLVIEALNLPRCKRCS